MARDLIVFGEDWGAHPSSTQHIVSRLARTRRVLWVNSIGLRRPRLAARDAGRLVAKARAALGQRPSARVEAPAGVRVVAPFAVSWPGSRAAAAFNRRVLGARLRTEIARHELKDHALWTSLPTALPLVGALGERACVYYCGDDFGALAGVDHAPVVAMERDLAARADLIIAASEPLAARFNAQRTLLAPHGVDYDLFATPAPRAPELATDRPTAGFYGSLAEWIDVPALAAAARALPHWDFVFIGPVQTDVSELAALPNVRMLGPRPHGELPRFSQHWSASLLPFRDTAQIRACNPLKLREYLAAGSPIVSTLFPAMAAYADCLTVCANPADLAQAIERAQADAVRNELRRARVAAESWDARARAVEDAIEAL